MKDKSEIVECLRELVAAIYDDCVGEYGAEVWKENGRVYEKNYESEIQDLANALVNDDQASAN